MHTRNTEQRPERNAAQETGKPGDSGKPSGLPYMVASASASDFQRDLSRYWRHVRSKGEVGLTARGWIYKTAFKALLAALNEPLGGPDSEQEYPRLFFMRQLLIGLRELAETQGAIRAQAGGQFFHMPLAARIKRAFETWRDRPMITDAGPLRRSALPGPRRDELALTMKARVALLRALARVEKNAALERALHERALHERALHERALHERALHERALEPGRASQPGERWRSTAALLDAVARPEPAGFRAIGSHAPEQTGLPDRLAMLSALAGPLHWLGLVDLGFGASSTDASRDQRTPAPPLPTAYRLTETGLWLLELADPPHYVENGGRVLVQPDFTILAMEPISDRVLMDLDQFADVQGGDRATAYQLTRESVYRGHQAGWDVRRIVSFLEAHQGAPLPPNIRRTLDEWETRHHRIVFHRQARVVQFADEDARDAVTHVLAQAQLAPVALGSAHALIQPGATMEAVIQALSEAGWIPQISAGDAADGSPARDDTEGCLRLVPSQEGPGSFDVLFKQPAPSLFALSQLAPFSGPVAPGRPLQITAAGVRNALAGDMTLDEILAILAHLHDGPLPAPVEQSIRDWARFFGRAAASAVCLFEFSHQEVLNNLLDDEAVGHYLKVIEGSLQPVAIVDAAHADMVREMLAERGIQVSGDGLS